MKAYWENKTHGTDVLLLLLFFFHQSNNSDSFAAFPLRHSISSHYVVAFNLLCVRSLSLLPTP